MWALDLGTTNTLLARWDDRSSRPQLLQLPSICRRPTHPDPLEAPGGVPSAVHVVDRPGWWARMGESPALARNFFFGKLAHIGRPALELNQLRHRPNYVPTFKRALSHSPLMTLARTGERGYTAREIGRLFLRELLAEARAVSGERVRELVITSPVEAFETYRAELRAICSSLGIRRLRFLDEPVAAALGYGLGLTRERRVLVVDFGGGTFHIALVALRPAQVQQGKSEVLAKAGRDVGGNLVDAWVLEEVCRRLGFSLDLSDEEQRLWRGLLLAEACRVKEAAYFAGQTPFEVAAPAESWRLEKRLTGEPTSLSFGRDELIGVLTEQGLYRTLEQCLDEVLGMAKAQGLAESDIEDVLMVGGSTLLPKVYGLFEQRFGRARVRAWQPFEAVAYGGSVFAANQVEPSDFIVHDYALLTHDPKSSEPQYAIVIPRGTRFPTAPAFWKRQLVPTCSLGEPERVFKLVVCELGSVDPNRKFSWDAAGLLHKATEGHGPVVVKLNAANPALGQLDPPHSPRDRSARLEVSFGVNAERWLCASVLDLQSMKSLMRDEPVIRLL